MSVQRDDSVGHEIFKMSLSSRDVKRFEVNAICWCSWRSDESKSNTLNIKKKCLHS